MNSHLFYTRLYGMREAHSPCWPHRQLRTTYSCNQPGWVTPGLGRDKDPYAQYVRVDFNLSPLLFSHISLFSIVGLHLRSFKYRTTHFLSHTPQSSFHTDRGYLPPFPLFVFVLTGPRLLQAGYMNVQSFFHSD